VRFGDAGVILAHGQPALDKRGALPRQISHLATFVQSRKLREMQPGDAPVKAGSAFAIASTNGLAAHLPHGGDLTLNLAKLTGALQARWFNPRSGSFSESFVVDGGRVHERTFFCHPLNKTGEFGMVGFRSCANGMLFW